MALNVVINGFVYYDDGTIAVDDVKYQMLFYPNGTASSPTTWNNVRVSEATGYWNANLGDGDWLTQEGTALSNAKVVVVFWKGNTTDRNDSCSVIEEWGATEITLDGSSTYSFNTQIKKNITPILNWTFPTDGLVGVSYTAVNNSYDVHTWDFNGVTMAHWYRRYGQNINIINYVNNSDYIWGDGNETLDVPNIANRSHAFLAAGNYDVDLIIEDECGATVTGTKPIRIEWNAPVPDIIQIPADPDPNEPVSFQYTGTDPNDRITSIDWVINDSGSYGTTNTTSNGHDRDDIVPHTDGDGTAWCGESAASGAYTNPGNHLVSIVVHWFDGFDNQTINYSETFYQKKFTGPTIDFEQVPSKATLASGVKFVNTSTDTDRVGTALPDCHDYDWTWTVDGTTTEYTDKPYGWELEVTPGSVDSQAKLCATWSDGWENQTECLEKDVVFDTTVTVTEEDCFFNLNVIGTSSDGSVTGYSWTVASGISETGPWFDTWTTPTGIDQNDKKVCFTAVGWYRLTGYVHGTGATTSDSETLYIDVVCPTTTSGIEVISHVWNGTGPLDVGGDWTHSQYGTETTESKHTGTNGLDATGMSKTDKIWFTSTSTVNANLYDTLVMWVNVKEWQSNKDVVVELRTRAGRNLQVNLSRYLTTDYINNWQKVVIPLTHFANSGEFLVDVLRLEPSGNIGIWLDDIYFSMGPVVSVAVCEPDVDAEEFGVKRVEADTFVPSGQADSGPVPSGRASKDYVPSGQASKDFVPKGRPAFPGPRNL